MTEEEIIQEWKKGYSAKQVAKIYMNNFNKNKKQGKIKECEAFEYVERIIYYFETKDWNRKKKKVKEEYAK